MSDSTLFKPVFKQGDIVLILYNNVMGRVKRIHGAGGKWLYDVLGTDSFNYPNQLARELRHVHLNHKTLITLGKWLNLP